MNKKLILGAMFSLIFAVIGGWALTQSVNVGQAVSAGSHWGNWVDNSSCIASECGTSEGTKTQLSTCLFGGGDAGCTPRNYVQKTCDLTCPTEIFSDSHEVCPTDDSYYTSNDKKKDCKQKIGKDWKYSDKIVETFGPINVVYKKFDHINSCYRPLAPELGVPIWAELKFVKVPWFRNLVETNCVGAHWVEAQTKSQTVSCNNAIVTDCVPTTYWCSPVEGGFLKVAVSSTPEDGGKLWTADMDDNCESAPIDACSNKCGLATSTVDFGVNGHVTCSATAACTYHNWCQENEEGIFEVIQVKDEDKNPKGKEWLESMDANCNVPVTCHKNMGEGVCNQYEQYSCNAENGELEGACNCQEGTQSVVTSTEPTYLTCQVNEEVPAEGTCSAECGYAGGTVPNGQGGEKTCPAVTCGGGSGGSGMLTHGFYAPEKFIFFINGGATTTDNRAVKLTIDGGADATKMALSNTEDFSTASQQAYATSADWTLASGKGVKKVYIKFYNVYGEKSEVVSSTIELTKDEVVALEPIVPQVLGVSVYNFTRNLYLGSRGEDVSALQQFLIDANVGPDARSLDNWAPSGYFGPYTKMALVEYQKSVGIWAAGNFGPITRAYVNGLTQ